MYKALTSSCQDVCKKIYKSFETNSSKILYFAISSLAKSETEYEELKTLLGTTSDIKDGYYIVRLNDKARNVYISINDVENTIITVDIPAGTLFNIDTYLGLLPTSSNCYIKWNGENSEKDTSNTFVHTYDEPFVGNIIISGYTIYRGQASQPGGNTGEPNYTGRYIKEIHLGDGLCVFERCHFAFDTLQSLERLSGNIVLSNSYANSGLARMLCNSSSINSLSNLKIKIHNYEPGKFYNLQMMFYNSKVDNNIINQIEFENFNPSDITNYAYCFNNTNITDYSKIKIIGKKATKISSAFFGTKISKLHAGYFDNVTDGYMAFIGCPITEIDPDFGLPSLKKGNAMFEDVPLDASHIIQIYNSLPPVPEGVVVEKTDNRNNNVDYHISFGYKKENGEASQTQEIIEGLGLVDDSGNPLTSLPLTPNNNYAKSRNGWRVGFCV